MTFLGLVVLGACGEADAPFDPNGPPAGERMPTAAAIPLTEIQHFPISFSEFLPCANGGAGEIIDWTGELKLVFHSTTLFTGEGDLKTLLAGFSFSGSLDGIGQTTGDRYGGRYSQHGPVHESQTLDSAAFNSNLVFDILVRGAGGALVGIQRIRAHTTIDASGEVVVQRFELRFTCPRT